MAEREERRVGLCTAASKGCFDRLFLDVDVPGMDGFDLAERLGRERPAVYLVFVSLYEGLVFEAQECSTLWFVRKGNLEKDVCRALRKYLRLTASMRVRCRVKQGYDDVRELLVRDIVYVEGSGHSLTDGSILKMGRDRRKV